MSEPVRPPIPPENVHQFVLTFEADGVVGQGTAAEPPPGQQPQATQADNEKENQS